MADGVSIIGTVVGVASLAIQVTDTLHKYWKGISNFQPQVRRMLEDTQRISEVLKSLQEFLERDPNKTSKLFNTTSTLYAANVRCELRLAAITEKLRKELEGSKNRKILRALKWPFEAEESQAISTELHGYIQTFQFALNLDGCKLLLHKSDEVSIRLEELALSSSTTQQQTQDISILLKAIALLPQTAYDIQESVAQLEARARNVNRDQILQWLGSNVAMEDWERTTNILGSRQAWSRKIVLLSCVVDRFIAETNRDEGVAFYYCEYSQAAESQCATAIVSNFLHQLILQLKETPEDLVEVCEKHVAYGTQATQQEIVQILLRVCQKFKQVWLLIDAIDELEPENKDDLMEVLDSIKGFTKIFLTSRPQPIDLASIEENTLRCSLTAQEEDLTAFIRARMGKAATASRRIRESPGWKIFVEDTVEKLLKIADGMFILVSLQLELLLKPRTVAEMRKCLQNISTKLDDFYMVTLNRIKTRESDMAMRVLSWVVKSLHPMSLRELQEALAVELSSDYIDDDAIVLGDDMVEMCCGFLVIDEGDNVALAHSTVHEFLMSSIDHIDQFDFVMARTCIRFLNFKDFDHQAFHDIMNVEYLMSISFNFHPGSKNFPVGWEGSGNAHTSNNPVFENRIREHPFLPYAAIYWSKHYRIAKSSRDLTEMALKLICGPNAPAMLQAYSTNKYIDMSDINPLHTAAFLGLYSPAKILIGEATQQAKKENPKDFGSCLESLIDSRTAGGNTPLSFAVQHKHLRIAKLLLRTKAVNPSVMDNTIFRWALSWDDEELLDLMIRMPKFNTILACRQFPGILVEEYRENHQDKFYKVTQCLETKHLYNQYPPLSTIVHDEESSNDSDEE